MPLLKLWNAIRGRSSNASNDVCQRQGQPKPSSDQDRQGTAEPVKPTKKPRATAGPARRRGLFRSGPHAGLCKQIRSADVSTVLEISVGDGSRAVAVMSELNGAEYLAIDRFDLAQDSISVKRFHTLLRAHGIRPRLFPGSLEKGLLQVLHTVGKVDLVLIGESIDRWSSPAAELLVSRLRHDRTTVLYLEGDQWRPLACKQPQELRKAA